MKRLKNHQARIDWISKTLRALPKGSSLLDVGAGECAYKPYCTHLEYLAQDIAEYDGQGDGAGLQTGQWDTSELDFVCDLYDIPEDRTFDTVFCSEVLEHVVDPVRAVEKMARLVTPGGRMILTAPFNSISHFTPYHFCSGFSQYFYRHHLERLGFEVTELVANGGFFDSVDQELGRASKVRRQFKAGLPDPVLMILTNITRLWVRLVASRDGPRMDRASAQLQTFGWFVVATKKAAQ
jgi:SAM-dependent methyltransferase